MPSRSGDTAISITPLCWKIHGAVGYTQLCISSLDPRFEWPMCPAKKSTGHLNIVTRKMFLLGLPQLYVCIVWPMERFHSPATCSGLVQTTAAAPIANSVPSYPGCSHHSRID
jgi:hypothetical protein